MQGELNQILITGCARSGTSFISGLINKHGIQGGTVLGPTPANRKGQFENRAITDTLVKPYLKENNFDPLGQKPIPKNVFDLPLVDSWKKDVEFLLARQGVDINKSWYYKGAKMCLMWPVWNNAFPDAKWIIVRRNDEAIINSCLRTHFMRKCKGREGWQAWIDEHKKRFEEMKINCKNVMEVWPEKIIKDFNLKEAENMLKYLCVKSNNSIIENSIDKSLWKG